MSFSYRTSFCTVTEMYTVTSKWLPQFIRIGFKWPKEGKRDGFRWRLGLLDSVCEIQNSLNTEPVPTHPQLSVFGTEGKCLIFKKSRNIFGRTSFSMIIVCRIEASHRTKITLDVTRRKAALCCSLQGRSRELAEITHKHISTSTLSYSSDSAVHLIILSYQSYFWSSVSVQLQNQIQEWAFIVTTQSH